MELDLKRWHTREDSGLRLDRSGQWWHDDQPVEHPKIVEAFNRGLGPSGDGRFILRFGADWAYVQVEGPAYQVVAVDLVGGQVFLRLSDRTCEVFDPQTLTVDGDEALCCRVKDGAAQARFSRDAQFALGEWLDATEDGLVLRLPQGSTAVFGAK